jgi:uncharacterized membrane protein YeaQ/YmgE (transglycosylase-associated protein family)
MGALLVIWAICGAIGYAIANPKGKGGAGIALGLLLGILGIIIAACLSDSPEVALRKQRLAPQAVNFYAPVQRQPQGLAGWHADPYQRHQSRYFDGFVWTNNVASNGIQSLEAAPVQ